MSESRQVTLQGNEIKLDPVMVPSRKYTCSFSSIISKKKHRKALSSPVWCNYCITSAQSAIFAFTRQAAPEHWRLCILRHKRLSFHPNRMLQQPLRFASDRELTNFLESSKNAPTELVRENEPVPSKLLLLNPHSAYQSTLGPVATFHNTSWVTPV